MKKITPFICLILICSFVIGQTQTNTKDYLLTKSKHHKTVAYILLGTGTVGIITGIIYSNKHKDGSFEQNFTGGFITAGGIACTLASIAYFASASNKKKKAASVAFGKQKILIPINNAYCFKTQPTLSLKIPIGR